MPGYADHQRSDKKKKAARHREHENRIRKAGAGAGAGARGDDPAGLFGMDREWDHDEFDLVPLLLTETPQWVASGLALEVHHGDHPRSGEPLIQRFGADDGDAIRIRLRGNHYSAIFNGKETYVKGGGNCFFYAVWQALQEDRHADAAHLIFNGREPLTRREASQRLRDAVRDHVARNPERIRALSGTPPAVADPGEAEDPATGGSSFNEVARTLFHAGDQLSAWIGHTALVRSILQRLAAISPSLGNYGSYALSAYGFLSALIQRDLLGGLMTILMRLPYQLLSPQNYLFAIAEATKRYIDSKMGYEEAGSLSREDEPQRETVYLCVGAVALIAQYLYFCRREVAFPQSALGKKMIGMIAKLKFAAQGYAVLESVVNTVPVASAADDSDLQAERMLLSRAEKKAQRQEKRTRASEVKAERARVRLLAQAQAQAHSPAPGRSANTPLIVAGSGAATGFAVFEFGEGAVVDAAGEGGAANAIENAALLVDTAPHAVATTGGVHSLIRKSALVGAAAGGVAGASYGLYWLVRWLERIFAQAPAPGIIEQANSATSASADVFDEPIMAVTDAHAVSYGNADHLVSTTPGPQIDTVSGGAASETEAAISPSSAHTSHGPTAAMPLPTPSAVLMAGTTLPTGLKSSATSEPAGSFNACTEDAEVLWPSGVDFDDMVDDFIISLSKEDEDFLAAEESAVPSESAMTSELIDLVLFTSGEAPAFGRADGNDPVPLTSEQQSPRGRLSRKLRSVDANGSRPLAASTTNELASWIRNNWPISGAFVPASDERLERTATGGYRSLAGNTYLYIGGAYWKFIATDLNHGALENEVTKSRILVDREMPNYIWGISEAERAILKLGPLPDILLLVLKRVEPHITPFYIMPPRSK